MDLAKGIILGVFGFSVAASEAEFIAKAIAVIVAAIFAGYFVRLGIILLKE